MLNSLSETIIISCDDSKTLCSSYGRQSISSQRMVTATVFPSEFLREKNPSSITGTRVGTSALKYF